MTALLHQHWALAAVALLPAIGALFALVMPGDDRLALRYVGMGVALGTVALVVTRLTGAVSSPLAFVVAGVRLSIDAVSLPVLLSLVLAAPVALRSGAPRVFERTQFYVVTILFVEALFAAAVVVDAVFIRLALATLGAVPFFALVALFGGPLRGTTTMRAVMIWLVVDIAALAILAWLASRAGVAVTRAAGADLQRALAGLPSELRPWIVIAIAAPGLVRLAAGPFSLWVTSFFEEAPVSAAILAGSGAAPLGALIVVTAAVPASGSGVAPLIPWAALVAAVAVILSGVIALAERDLRRLLAQLVQGAGATAAVSLLALDERAVAVGVVHAVASGASAALVLAAIEAVERRAETRDAVELAGLGQANPLLALLLVAGLAALAGVPVLGAGSTLWLAVGALARLDGLAAAGTPPLMSVWLAVALVVGALIAAAGVMGVARRLLQPAPARRSSRIVAVLTFGQAARLCVPAACVVAVGVGAGSLVDAGAASVAPVVRAARLAAGLPALPWSNLGAPPAAPSSEPVDGSAPAEEGAPAEGSAPAIAPAPAIERDPGIELDPALAAEPGPASSLERAPEPVQAAASLEPPDEPDPAAGGAP